jgi:hypothetical protein
MEKIINTNIQEYCDDIRIKHEVYATYIPQQNVVADKEKYNVDHSCKDYY